MIWHDINELVAHLHVLQNIDQHCKIFTTSGGFDPIHVGHLRCIQETANMATQCSSSKVIIIVNGDGFLHRKKGYAFMSIEERMEIISGINGVDEVTTWDDGGQTVSGAISLLRPHYFTKGGDRTDISNVPENDACELVGCKIIFGVGGEKIQSSSNLVKNMGSQNR